MKAEVGTWCQLLFSWGGREKERTCFEVGKCPEIWSSAAALLCGETLQMGPMAYSLLKHQNKTSFLASPCSLAWGCLKTQPKVTKLLVIIFLHFHQEELQKRAVGEEIPTGASALRTQAIPDIKTLNSKGTVKTCREKNRKPEQECRNIAWGLINFF